MSLNPVNPLNSVDPFVIALFFTILVSVTFLILRRSSNPSEETTYDLETVSMSGPEATHGPDAERNQLEDDAEPERSDAHRAPRGRKRELPFSNNPQPTQFGGGFNSRPQSDAEFGNGFGLSETPRLDQTSPWALPPDKAENEGAEGQQSHESETTEHDEFGSADRDQSDPSPYLHSGLGDRSNNEDDEGWSG